MTTTAVLSMDDNVVHALRELDVPGHFQTALVSFIRRAQNKNIGKYKNLKGEFL